MLMKHQINKAAGIQKLLQIVPRNGHVEFYGKNDQPRKNLDKSTIYFF